MICLVFVGMQASTVRADDLPVEYVSGTLESSQTWTSDSGDMITGMVTVPDEITLTIEEGTIVKIGQFADGIAVSSGGTLDVAGATAQPIVFTSYKGDSVGGDSNIDGFSEGAYGDYSTAIKGNGGTLNVQNAQFESRGILDLLSKWSGQCCLHGQYIS